MVYRRRFSSSHDELHRRSGARSRAEGSSAGLIESRTGPKREETTRAIGVGLLPTQAWQRDRAGRPDTPRSSGNEHGIRHSRRRKGAADDGRREARDFRVFSRHRLRMVRLLPLRLAGGRSSAGSSSASTTRRRRASSPFSPSPRASSFVRSARWCSAASATWWAASTPSSSPSSSWACRPSSSACCPAPTPSASPLRSS